MVPQPAQITFCNSSPETCTAALKAPTGVFLLFCGEGGGTPMFEAASRERQVEAHVGSNLKRPTGLLLWSLLTALGEQQHRHSKISQLDLFIFSGTLGGFL